MAAVWPFKAAGRTRPADIPVQRRAESRSPRLGPGAQSAEHLRTRQAFTGCNAGHTFFHADPHGKASICKIGRDDQVDLMAEGLDGLRRLGGIADQFMLRTGGCSGCQLAGTCRVCRPLAKRFQEAKAPLGYYCQHGDNNQHAEGNRRPA